MTAVADRKSADAYSAVLVAPRQGCALDDFLAGLGFYYVTSLVVGLGLLFGSGFVPGPRVPAAQRSAGFMDGFIRFDGTHYRSIAQDGYEYDPDTRSSVAFFPAYPLLTRFVTSVTGLQTEAALLLVSNASLAAAFVLLARYLRVRNPAVPPNSIGWALLTFGLWPATFFFRVAYAESLFLACALFTLYGITRGWPLVPLALAAGLATATRPVGVAVTAAFLWHVLARPEPWAARLRQACALVPLACWGLLAYMAYQWAAFGTPLAFAQTQEHWTHLTPVEHPGWGQKLWALATLEPIRGVYDPHSPRFWYRSEGDDNVLFVLSFWNPVLFVLAGGLLALGAWRRWLTGPELVLGVGLLAIPYLARAYEMSMASHGRFAAVVIPNYLVLGRLLAAAPAPVAAVAVSLSACLLAFWTALYTAGYPFF
jgi:hypothetical protein